MSGQKRRILINSLFNAMSFVVQVVVVFFVSPILVHGLGDDRYGVWTLVNSVMAYIALADLGIGAAVLRYVARFEALHDEEAINQVFSTSLAIFASAGAVVLLVTSGLAILWQHPFGLEADLAGEMRWMLGLLGANFALLLPMSNYKTVLRALEKYPTVNTIRVGAIVLRNVAFVAILHLGGGLLAIGLAIMVSGILDTVGSVWAAHHCLPSLRFSFRLVNRKTLRTIWAYSVFVFLSVIVGTIGSQSNALVIGAFLPAAAVAYFGIAANLSSQASEGLVRAIAVLTPAVSKWEARGDTAAVATLLVRGTRYLLYLAMPIQAGLLLLGRPFLALWMGQEYAEVCYPPLAILSLALTLTLAMAMAARILEGLGKVGNLFASTVIQAVLTVCFSIALVRPLGIAGVAWATTVPLALQSIVVIAIACRASRVSVWAYAVHAWGKSILAVGVLALVWCVAQAWLPPVLNWVGLFVAGLVGLAAYFPAVLCLDAGLRRFARQMQAGLGRSLRSFMVAQDGA